MHYPVTGIRSLLRRMRFLKTMVVHVKCLRHWMNTDVPAPLQAELQRSGLLLKTISNPYIHRLWDFQERTETINEHYRLLGQPGLAFFDFDDGQYWNCASFEMDDKLFRIVVDRADWMRAEGEMCLSLFMGVDRLYSIAFSVGTSGGSRRLLVGAIQGASQYAGGTLYSDLTKLFHGARPRDLMVQVLKMVAHNVGCDAVWAVADDFHQSVGRGNEFVRAAKYDDIWLENGGVKNDAGFFVMGTALQKRADADIPARKRALYRRRYELLDNLQEKVRLAFAADTRETRPHCVE